MRKIISLLVICVFLFSMIAGCGSKPVSNSDNSTAAVEATTQPETSVEEQTEKASEPVKISFINKVSNRAEILKKVVENFNSANPDVIVEFESPAQNFDTVLKTRLATNDPPDICTHIIGQATKPYVEANQIVDITNEPFMKKIIPVVVEMMKYNGKNYGVPLDASAWGIFYNKKLFQKAGIQDIPKTLDEFADVTKKIKDAGITPFSVGLTENYIIGQVFDLGGSPVMSKLVEGKMDSFLKGDFTFNGAEMENIFKALDILVTNAQKTAAQTDTSKQYADFAAEKTAMMPQGSWSIMQLHELNKDLDAGFFPLPVSNNPEDNLFPIFYALTFNVMSNKNMDAVRKFMDYMLDAKANSIYYNSIGVPTAVVDAKDAQLDPMTEIMNKMNGEGKIVSWLNNVEPAGFANEAWRLIQTYALDIAKGKAMKHEDLFKQLDEALKKVTAPK